jgi:glutathione S-transferase
MTITLFDFHDSGNGYKVRLLMSHLRLAYRYVEVDILSGE